jgi:hypothetical protein
VRLGLVWTTPIPPKVSLILPALFQPLVQQDDLGRPGIEILEIRPFPLFFRHHHSANDNTKVQAPRIILLNRKHLLFVYVQNLHWSTPLMGIFQSNK